MIGFSLTTSDLLLGNFKILALLSGVSEKVSFIISIPAVRVPEFLPMPTITVDMIRHGKPFIDVIAITNTNPSISTSGYTCHDALDFDHQEYASNIFLIK